MVYLYGEYNSGSVMLLGERVDPFMILEHDKVTENTVFLILEKQSGLKLKCEWKDSVLLKKKKKSFPQKSRLL